MYSTRNSTAGNPHIVHGQSPYYRVADSAPSPGNSTTGHASSVLNGPNSSSRELHPWAIPASPPPARLTVSNSTISNGNLNIEETPHNTPRGTERYEQRYMYLYNALAGGVSVQFILTCVRLPDRPMTRSLIMLIYYRVEAAPLTPDESVLTLTCKSGGIERSLCGREYLRLNVDPRTLKFHIL